jgi:hypothetical protein
MLGFVLRGPPRTVAARRGTVADWVDRLAALVRERGTPLGVTTDAPSGATFSADAFARAADAVAEGRATWLAVDDGRAPRWGSPMGMLELAWLSAASRPDVAEVRFVARFGGAAPLREPEFVGLAAELGGATGLPQGLLLPQQPPRLWAGRTDLEDRALGEGVTFGPRALARYARGPAWGLWLTRRHVEGLGGRERVLREAPVALAFARPGGVWLELTASPWDVPDAALRRLEAYLVPILPSLRRLRATDAPPQRRSAGGVVTPADAYAGHRAPRLPWEWTAGADGDSVALTLRCAQAPSPEAAAALDRAVAAWYDAGAAEAFPGGGFHYLSDVQWDGSVAHWWVDVGFAEVKPAVDDLARRLAGWSAAWSCPVASLTAAGS